jgi:hypothetical protein
MENHADLFLRQAHVCTERFLAQFREPLAALLALPTLRIVPPTSRFHRFDFAIVARHFEPCFLQAKSSK